MANRLSRRKLAIYAADKLVAGASTTEALAEVAAHLVDTGRTRERELLVRDIEEVLAERGIVVADVTTAHPLTDKLRTEIQEVIGAKSLQLRELIDSTVLGGVRIDVPGKRFDGTIQQKLTSLKAKQL
jgi:F-type H+-transporting ATPase subunit delta